MQRESFPKLDLVAAKSALNRTGGRICVFEQGRRMIGQLFIPVVMDKSIVARYIFASERMLSIESEALLKTKDQSTHLDKFRRIFECPGCGKGRWTLYYMDDWACADCLGLLYRSQLIDKEVKLWEERDRLGALLKRGRPKGMHNRSYIKHRLRLAELERRLAGRQRKYPSDENDLIVTAKWVPPSEIELWFSSWTVVSGVIVRTES